MKKTLFAYLFVLCNLTLFAQTRERPRIVHTKEKSAIHVPPQEAPAGLKEIYSNLGPSKTDLFHDIGGWLVAGVNSSDPQPESIAMPFTPKSNSHVSLVGVAVQYGGSGANQVNLNIYDDSGGVPGTLLAGPVTVVNLPDEGTCCTLAVANFTPLEVTGGIQYWVVANTPISGTGSDSVDSWAFTNPSTPVASVCCGSPWELIDGNLEPAGAVLGTIP